MAKSTKGKRGPARYDPEVLRKRGSYLGKVRERQAKAVPTLQRVEVPSVPIGDLSDLICQIPGYDPYAQAGDCVFDEDSAVAAIEWIESELVHVKGELAGRPFILERWERAIVANLFGWKRPDGTRRYRYAFIFVPRKNGKMLDLAAWLPTPDGWTTVGEVEVGDTLFDENGLPCRVRKVHPVDRSPKSYLVKFSNGEEVKACADHLWVTTARVDKPGDKTSGRTKRPLTRVRTTQELFETQTFGKRNDRNHRVDMPDALHLPTADLPIDPYVLGSWLGDGSSDSATMTCGDEDIGHFVKEFHKAGVLASVRGNRGRAATIQLRASKAGTSGARVAVSTAAPDNLQRLLRHVGVLGDKHIPPVYLRASVSQRLALLQGLMDTDGTADQHGRACEYVTTAPKLRDGIGELLASLGVKFTTKATPAKLNGRTVGTKYRTQFYVSPDVLPVFRMQRKLDRLILSADRKTAQRSRSVMIASVEPCDPVPMRCLTVDSPSGLFRFGETMLPTHNTAFSAALILYMLFEDREPGAEILGAASEYTQASFVFQHARGMVTANEGLLDRCQIFKGQAKSIQLTSDYSTYRVIAGVEASVHGTNPSAYIVDELHKITDVDFIDAIETGTGARRQPLGIYITTSDFQKEVSPCNEKHEYASKVRDSIIEDPALLPVIYEAQITDDWTDPAIWAKANPNLGVSLTEEYIRSACEKAKGSPRFENTFKRLHLNIRTEQDVRWLPMDKWDACDGEWSGSLDGQLCYAGLDMSSTVDITAFVLVFPECGNAVLPFFWIPGESAYRRAKHDKVPYLDWEKAGLLTMTRKESVDHDAVRNKIVELAGQYRIQEIAVDRWNATQIVDQLDGEGFEMVKFGQGFASMSAPSKELERLVMSGDLLHGGNPVLRWMASNVAIETDAAENIKPSKKKSTERIDGIVGLVMALGRAICTDTEDPYADRGVLSLETL